MLFASHVRLLTMASLLVLTAACSDEDSGTPPVAPDPHKLVLLYTSDEHSEMMASSPERDDFPMASAAGEGKLHGGVARRAALLSRERADAKARGIPTLTLSAGDNAMGTLLQIAWPTHGFELRQLKSMGYNATTLGNHDFDLNLDRLASALSAAHAAGGLPAVVASNIHFDPNDPADDALAALYGEGEGALIKPYQVIELENGRRVGIVGWVGVDSSAKSPFKAPVTFSEHNVAKTDADNPEKVLPELYAEVQSWVDKLRNEHKVDLVIGLGHAGVNLQQPEYSEDDKIAANVAGIDVIISGHAHVHDATPLIVKNTTTQRDVIVLDGGARGAELGRIELSLPEDATQSVGFEPTTQALLPIDDKVVPDPAMVQEVQQTIEELEKVGPGGGSSWLEQFITRAVGSTVANDPSTPGDLYFYTLGNTAFDLPGKRPLAFFTEDAHLAMLQSLGMPAQFSIQASGTVRSELLRGATGQISFADAFRVVPLGVSPVDGSPGYPLVRVKMPVGALRLLLEFTQGIGQTDDSFDLTTGGVVADYDCSRAPIMTVAEAFNAANGRIMKLWMDSDPSDGYEQFDKLVWDRANPPSSVLGGDLYVVVTSIYIAQIMANKGVALKDMNDQPAQLTNEIVRRPDQSEVKELESFFAYLRSNDTIPERYNPSSPQATARFTRMAHCP